MTKDECTSLLIEQGAVMLRARVQMHEAKEHWAEAARILMENEDVHGLSAAEQEDCFRKSCVLAGLDPDDAVFDIERHAIRRGREQEQEQHLESLRDNAAWN